MTSLRQRGRQQTPLDHLDSFHAGYEDHHIGSTLHEEDEHSEQTLVEEPREGDGRADGDIEKGKQLQKDQREKRRSRKVSIDPGGPLRRHETQKPDYIVGFDGPDDPANAKAWPMRKKAYTTLLLGLTTAGSQFVSSTFSAGITQIGEEFHISQEVGVLVTALYVLGYVPGPTVWGPLSELYGRKMSILIPYFIFICFTAGSATAANAQTLFITRFFAGFFASAPVTNVGGGIGDMFDAKQRATAVVFYSFAVVAGPTLGPLVGSAIATSYLGWRWIGYISVIMTSFILILDVLFLPETFAPALLTRKAVKLRLATGNFALHSKHEEQDFALSVFLQKSVIRPIKLLYSEPICAAVVVYNAFTYSLLYLLFEAFPIAYGQNRGWPAVTASLPFLAIMIGCVIAGCINIAYTTKYYAPLVDKYAAEGKPVPPEYRLPPMMLGAALFPISLFWFAWTSQPEVLWVSSVFAVGLIGISFLLIFQSGLNYLLDAFLPVAASVVAANTVVRSLLAGGFPMFALPFFHNLGVPKASSTLGGLAVGLAVIPYLFWIFGARLRAMSRYAVSHDD